MTEQEFFWLAGLLEGEGSFLCGPPSAPNKPCIGLNMTDEDIVARVANLWRQSYHRVQIVRNEAHGWKPSYYVNVRGKPAVELMKQLLPYMGKRRQEQISKAITSYNPYLRNKLSPAQVEEIKSKLLSGCKHSELAHLYGVDRSTISHIKAAKRPAYR